MLIVCISHILWILGLLLNKDNRCLRRAFSTAISLMALIYMNRFPIISQPV